MKREISMFLEKLDELIDRKVEPLANATVGFQSLDEINRKTNEWIYDVKIFNERYLKKHPLYRDIDSAVFHKRLGVVGVLKSCLKSIRNDSAFLEECQDKFKEPKNIKIFHKYDLFLSHANKDKEGFVDELFVSLDKLGINIFYDTKSIQWGDNWKNRILDGVSKSEFAIIVISKNFFDRDWTEKELYELLNRQNESKQKIVLPILKDITIDELRSKYPLVADIQAIKSSDYSCDKIAILFAKQFISRLKGE